MPRKEPGPREAHPVTASRGKPTSGTEGRSDFCNLGNWAGKAPALREGHLQEGPGRMRSSTHDLVPESNAGRTHRVAKQAHCLHHCRLRQETDRRENLTLIC
jgi:hypothetical protein